MNSKIKHLEMIQAVISRLGGNLFFLKGWTITLIVALLSLASQQNSFEFLLIAFITIIIFWTLEGYFLSIERSYRSLFDEVRKISKEKNIDFSMNYKIYCTGRNSWMSSLFSWPILIFYGLLLLALLIVSYGILLPAISFTVNIG